MPTSQGRPFIGSIDFMDLFKPAADWNMAASHFQVFKLYGEWVAYHAADEELKQLISSIQQRRLALAVEAGPITPEDDCGQGVEGFAGIEEGIRIADRIHQVGGRIDLIAMDEPYFYGHFYDGSNACQWTDEKIALNIDRFIQEMRKIFPDVLIGDTEPLAGPAGAPQYQAWLVSFRAVTGYDLDFLHMDIDWSRPDWPAEIQAIERFGAEHSIPVGIIYTGNSQDASDQSWISIAGERIKRYEIEQSGKPAHVLFQSWNDKPDRVLPESDRYTFTGLIREYFENKSMLGFSTKGRGSNLAYKKSVRFSQTLPGYTGVMAVDGDPGTLWNSGADAPQWIELDLGEAFNIQEIRLIVSQYPRGMTVHSILARGAANQDEYVTLHVFSGITDDGTVLSVSPESPWQEVRYIRIESIQSPSWIAWREIEIIDAGDLDPTQN